MVAAVYRAINPQTATQRGHPHNPTRSPLLPSEPDNALAPPTRKPKAREVTSRYMWSSSSSSNSSYSSSNLSSISRRCHSPLMSKTANSTVRMTSTPPAPSLTERSKSVERRTQVASRPNSFCVGMGNGGGGTNKPAAQNLLFTSTRSLSVSFQGESFSIQVSKAKPAPAPNLMRTTPERKKVKTPARLGNASSDQTEKSRLMDQQRWPGRMRQGNCTSGSMDCAEEKKKLGGSWNVIKSLPNLIVDVQSSFEGTVSLEMGSGQVRKTAKTVLDKNKANGCELHGEPFASDNESVSSGSSPGSEAHDYGSDAGGEAQRVPHGTMVPERFWQETKSRLGRQTDPVSPSSRNSWNKALAPPRLPAPRKLVFDSISSPRGALNNRGQLSPIRASARPATPGKLATQPTPSISTPSRGLSRSPIRNGVAGGVNSSLSNVPSILSFSVDVQRGKIGENRIVDAHLLRILHNRLLQWRFVNARADVALSGQRLNAEKSLYDAWVATSKLRDCVRAKRTKLQLLKQHFKLLSILKEQMIYLEDWALLDRGYSSSLSGAIEALKASTLRLPVVGGAKANALNVKDAVCSAVDVMQAMASSICLLSPKVGNLNSLVIEVANLRAKERVLLDECKYLLSAVAGMQATECSLRTQILQSECSSQRGE